MPVWAVLDYTNAPLVARELLLAKINILGPEYFQELLSYHIKVTARPASAGPHDSADSDGVESDFNPSGLATSDALRHKHEYLENIAFFTHQFGGKVLDVSTYSCTVEVCVITLSLPRHSCKTCAMFVDRPDRTLTSHMTSSAKPSRIDSFMKLVAPFGILESARTGLMALPRSPLSGPHEDATAKEADEVVDASQLPPG